MNWFFLRGLGRQQKHWGDFPQKFQQNFPQDKFHLLDLPGSGERRTEVSPKTIRGIKNKVREEALKLGWPTFSLLSMSLGSMVALCWQEEHDREIAANVIVNTSSRLSPFYQRLSFKAWGPFLLALSQKDEVEREKILLRLISGKNWDSSLAETWGEIAKKEPVGLKTLVYQLLAASTYKPKFHQLNSDKVLFLSSAQDRFVDPKCSKRLVEEIRCDASQHPWAGHDLFLDDPEWVCHEIGSWIK